MSLRRNSLKRLSNFLLSNYVNTSPRVRLAQDLHDGIAQDLVALGYGVDALFADEKDEIKRASLRLLRLDITSLIEKVRLEIFDLRKENIHEDLIESHPIIKVELAKVFNEIIENVLQHSEASALTLVISDNGIGGAQSIQSHHGLQGCEDRIRILEGEIEVGSDFTGTSVKISIPLRHI